VRRDDVCRGEKVPVLRGFERRACELFNLDALTATKLRELLR